MKLRENKLYAEENKDSNYIISEPSAKTVEVFPENDKADSHCKKNC